MLFLLLLTSDERMASDGWMLNESQEALIEGERILWPSCRPVHLVQIYITIYTH